MNDLKANPQIVAVLGASPKPTRYSNMAVNALLDHGHTVIPIHPTAVEIAGIPVKSCLNQIDHQIDTLTIYVSPERLEKIKPFIIELKPRRVIFNPGSEEELVMNELQKNGIEVKQGCTLVMLKTGQF
jgi:predicted CoA-binding protein